MSTEQTAYLAPTWSNAPGVKKSAIEHKNAMFTGSTQGLIPDVYRAPQASC